jgi:hypothetical protein
MNKNPFQAKDIEPGDENIYENSPRNMLVSYLGLPDDWRENKAQQKQWEADAPMRMGMGAMGTIGAVGAAENTLVKGAGNLFSKLGRVEAPAIQNIGTAEAVHGIEKAAASEAMEKAGQLAQKGTERFKQLFQQFKNEAMKNGGA